MMKSTKNGQTKRQYRKPGLRVVKLAAKEVLGDGCKIAGSGVGSLVNPCTTESPCSSFVGS
jgi:hypothetical protein